MTDRPDPNAMMARLEEMQRQAESTLARFAGLQEQLDEQAVEVYSDDGLLSVTLDKEGRIARIRIDEYAMRMRQSLGPMLVQLIALAKSEHEARTAELAVQFLAGDPNLAGWLDRMPKAPGV